MSLFKIKSFVGLEMDAYEIRAAEIGGTAAKPSLISFGKAGLPEGVVKDGKVARPDLLSGIISRLWTDAKFKSRNVILGVSNQDVLIRTALIPRCPPEKLDSVIRFQAQDFLPVSTSDVELDYIVLDDMENTQAEMIRVLLVAGRHSMLDGFLQAIGGAGLKLVDIDVSLLAVARLAGKQATNQVLAVVHFTKEHAGMAILENGLPVLARILPVPAVAHSAGENDGAGLPGEKGDYGTFPGFTSESIIGEISSFISYFLSQSAGAVVEKCMINFVSGHETDLKNKLGERLGIAIEVIDPAKDPDLDHPAGINSFAGAEDFSAAISLALRGLEE